MIGNTSLHGLCGINGLGYGTDTGPVNVCSLRLICTLQDPFQPSPASDVSPPHTQSDAQMAALHASSRHPTAMQVLPAEAPQQTASTTVAAVQSATKPTVPYASPFANNEMLTPGSGSASGGSGAAGLAAGRSAGQGSSAASAAQQSGERQATPPVVDFGCVHGAVANVRSFSTHC